MWYLFSKETTIHFGMQFLHTDLFVLEQYLQFFFNEIGESCENYIGTACFQKHGFEWLTRFRSTWLFETKKPKCILIGIKLAILNMNH